MEHRGLNLLGVESRDMGAQVLGALLACLGLEPGGVLAHNEEWILAMVVEEVAEGRCCVEGSYGVHLRDLGDMDDKRGSGYDFVTDGKMRRVSGKNEG